MSTEKLRALYREHKDTLEEVRKTFGEEKLRGPLLMELDSYYDLPIKLFVIGQQISGDWWYSDPEYKKDNTHNQSFLLRKYIDMRKNWIKDQDHRPFWNYTKTLEKTIGIPESQYFSCAWSNINRYAQYDPEKKKSDRPIGKILNKIETLDFLLKEEILITKPDICLFFTNKKYDYRLKKLYPNIKRKPIDGLPFNDYVKLSHPSLPKHSYRTPHPSWINRFREGNKSKFDEVIKLLPKVSQNK